VSDHRGGKETDHHDLRDLDGNHGPAEIVAVDEDTDPRADQQPRQTLHRDHRGDRRRGRSNPGGQKRERGQTEPGPEAGQEVRPPVPEEKATQHPSDPCRCAKDLQLIPTLTPPRRAKTLWLAPMSVSPVSTWTRAGWPGRPLSAEPALLRGRDNAGCSDVVIAPT
jgi:hypothetical protein